MSIQYLGVEKSMISLLIAKKPPQTLHDFRENGVVKVEALNSYYNDRSRLKTNVQTLAANFLFAYLCFRYLTLSWL